MRRDFPRLPLDGLLDLTYRCNNKCRHCWLWLSANAPQEWEELSFEEIQRIVDEARAMGCQAWSISGGEPMLRPDFAEIFTYITSKAVTYRLNTNGTLITPEIARLLKRKGKKMVALYGATAEVHDHITRSPGAFEATMRGFAYLKEAGAGFCVQIVPMQDNYHQYNQMLALSQSLSPHYRIGAPWLWLSACHSESRNHEIIRQRLNPAEVISLDEPDPIGNSLDTLSKSKNQSSSLPCVVTPTDDSLYASCIAARRDFHIDPYGQMSFCYYIKDPALRYDLRKGSFQQAWNEFIPSLADTVHGGQEYLENCGSCDLRQDCRWCAVFGYLECGRHSAKVEYLCQVAAEAQRFKEDWRRNHVRYFHIAGITIQVSGDFPITEKTFSSNIHAFQVAGPGDDTVSLRLISSIPPMSDVRLGKKMYAKSPWVIFKQGKALVYLGVSAQDSIDDPHVLAIFDQDHQHGTIFRRSNFYTHITLHALTTFPSDQILLARILSIRQACYIHSAGVIFEDKGLLFVGHSGAGKSTMMKMLKGRGEILCDDRIILRRWPNGFRIHGTWSHGEVPDVSPASAPLQAILYLEQAPTNEIIPLNDKRERLGRMLSHVVKPLVTADWWENILDLAGKAAVEIPTYRLRFDKSGKVMDLLQQLCAEKQDG